jgi:uncharacterized protein
MRGIFKAALAMLSLAVSFSGPAAAGALEDGSAAFSRGDYPTAMRLIRPLAEQGVVISQRHLGDMFREGDGVAQNYDAAISWYRMATDQGDAIAQHNLGSMYEKGQGVPQNYAVAASLYRSAASRGHVMAQLALGIFYGAGIGVPTDIVQSHMWFNLSAASASKPDVRALAIQGRDAVAGQMTPAQISEAQKLAREWKPRHNN